MTICEDNLDIWKGCIPHNRRKIAKKKKSLVHKTPSTPRRQWRRLRCQNKALEVGAFKAGVPLDGGACGGKRVLAFRRLSQYTRIKVVWQVSCKTVKPVLMCFYQTPPVFCKQIACGIYRFVAPTCCESKVFFFQDISKFQKK